MSFFGLGKKSFDELTSEEIKLGKQELSILNEEISIAKNLLEILEKLVSGQIDNRTDAWSRIVQLVHELQQKQKQCLAKKKEFLGLEKQEKAYFE